MNNTKTLVEQLEEQKEAVTMLLFGMSYKEAVKQKICLNCQQTVNIDKLTEQQKEGYLNTGICEECFTKTIAGFDATKGEKDG